VKQCKTLVRGDLPTLTDEEIISRQVATTTVRR
jgi:hypothetical protein